MSTYTPSDQVGNAYSTLHKVFKSGKTKSLAWRKWQLKQIWWMVADNEQAIVKALHADLNRHDFETYYADIGAVKRDILDHIKNFESWAADELPDAGFLFGTLCAARIRKEPLGVALILGTWNFPFVVTLLPLMAAVAAGCAVMVKPSEVAAASQDLLVGLIPKYLDPEAIRCVSGGPKETAALLERRFDSIFYTGSPRVGKLVSLAAAKHLTPVVLELGGQAPCIVTPSADIDLAAKRITYSKVMNAGQACLSANHVFIDPSIHDQFVERAKHWFRQYAKGDGSRIVDERNFDRLVGILDHSKGKVVYGGDRKRDGKYIQPTIVTDVDMQDSLLSEELFGPLLPIIKAPYLEACRITSTLEHPLGLYIFSTNQREIDEIITLTTSGGVTINDTMLHAGVPNAPFGGVGHSGTGAYHGRYGFDAFTHRRTVLPMPGRWIEYVLGFRYPPYDAKHIEKVTVGGKNPGFRRGEGMEEQRVGGGWEWGEMDLRRWFGRGGREVDFGWWVGRWVLLGLALVVVNRWGRGLFVGLGLEVVHRMVNGSLLLKAALIYFGGRWQGLEGKREKDFLRWLGKWVIVALGLVVFDGLLKGIAYVVAETMLLAFGVWA